MPAADEAVVVRAAPSSTGIANQGSSTCGGQQQQWTVWQRLRRGQPLDVEQRVQRSLPVEQHLSLKMYIAGYLEIAIVHLLDPP